MSQKQTPNTEYHRDASSFTHPADPSNTAVFDDTEPVNDNSYQRTYPPPSINNSSTFLQPQQASRRHAHRQDGEMPLSQTNIYVRGLPPDFTSSDLQDLCTKFGRVVSTKAVLEPESNKCRGYGFIDFESPQAASQALASINSEGVFEAEAAKELRGRSIDRHLEQDPTNLYIANLPREFTESSIRDMLSQHGMVISTRVLRNPDGTSRCVGFARMETKQCCDQIIAFYNGKKLNEDGDPLVVKLADSARRPKHSTSSSGQSSSDQTNIYTNWPPVQTGRYTTYPASAAGYSDQFSFSPILPNGGFQVYDPYGQNLTNVTNVQSAVPVNVQYPIIYQSPTRQLPSNVQPQENVFQSKHTPNQMVYQTQMPMQQQTNDYYSKNMYKPQNPPFHLFYQMEASDYVINQQQYVQSPAAYSTANIVSGQEYIYANGSANPIYVTGQFYPGLSQLPMQMTDSTGNPAASTSSYSNDPADVARPASVEKYEAVGSSASQQFPSSNVRPYASDTKLNNS